MLLLGSSEADTVAMNTRIAEALAAMDARYDECEKEAIQKCTAAKDPAILVEFWLAMERPADPDRAELICDPQGYQFEFSGSGTGTDVGYPVQVTWHVWGLLCEGNEQWRVWEEFETEGGGSSDTGPPGDSRSVPILITFGEDGAMTDSTWVFDGYDYLAAHGPRTVGGITFTLSPPEGPTRLDAVVPLRGEPSARVTVPVVPAMEPSHPANQPLLRSRRMGSHHAFPSNSIVLNRPRWVA